MDPAGNLHTCLVATAKPTLTVALRETLPPDVDTIQVSDLDGLHRVLERPRCEVTVVLDLQWLGQFTDDQRRLLATEIATRQDFCWIIGHSSNAKILSSEWTGITFFFSLPLDRFAVHAQLATQRALQQRLALSETMVPSSKEDKEVTNRQARILVLDDYAPNLKALEFVLEPHYEVVCFNSPVAAWEWLENREVDLILLDILMPDISGYEFKSRLHRSERLRDVPVIFMSALDEASDESKGLSLGAVDYITKPFSFDVVLARVARQLSHFGLKRQLERLSLTDDLTGLPNRRYFDSFAKTALRAAQRAGLPLTVAMLDIDLFKTFNDTYGHVAGDECLANVAGALRDVIHRETDCVARYGGEEFACLLYDTDAEGAKNLAMRLLQAVRNLCIPHIGANADRVTVSVGLHVTEQWQDLTDLKQLLDQADRCLYRAKGQGRNSFEITLQGEGAGRAIGVTDAPSELPQPQGKMLRNRAR